MNELPAPDFDQPEARLGKHNGHYDPVVFVSSDGGWSWKRRGAVNLQTENAALAFLLEHGIHE